MPGHQIEYNEGMYADFVDPFYLIRLKRGEEVIRTLASWAGQAGIPGGMLSGLGAMKEVTLGYFDDTKREYRKWEFKDPVEILSLSGGISILHDKPYIHLHAVIGDAEGRAWGGHLFQGIITATGEIYVLPARRKIARVPDSEGPFNLLDLPTFPFKTHA